ncbi:MAG: ABC transporter ATP-binding protein, partial [Rhodospirillales bacterium]|nr:ABC transporter ATP-binding protein [Rhodospirillales bacterium]
WVEYAGGYSDMLAQRGPLRMAPSPAARTKPATPAAPRPAAPARKRMTFKDRHALETLPARIEALQQEIAKLNAAIADPDLYARDAARFQRTTAAIATAQQALSEAEEQWLALEMLREEIEG